MASELLVSFSLGETRVAKLENGELVEYNVEREEERNIVGNIYVGRIARVLPGMQACFVDIGLSRTGFLHVSNILDPDAQVETIEEEDLEDDTTETELSAETAIEKYVPVEKDISKLVREGDSILVQVLKAPMGTKGPRLSGVISIPGRFLVYLPHSNHIGVSRRIENADERSRLKNIVEKTLPKQGGVIVRTVAEGASEKNIKDDFDYLIKLWGSVKKKHQKNTKPGAIYTDLDLSLKILRDRVTEDVDRIVVDATDLYKPMQKFIQSFLPRFKKRVELHTGIMPLFATFGIDTILTRLMSRKVWLKSGGYIIIDENEALTAIDVNTGRYVGKRNLEDTILQTNLEAVKEIAYQIRLRNLGGIIVLDFIDMDKIQNRDKVYQTFLEEMTKDPVKTHVLPISSLGLIEMTRKRTQESLKSKLSSPCRHCEGRGYVRSPTTIVHEIYRASVLEAKNSVESSGVLTIYCSPHIAAWISDPAKSTLDILEKEISLKVSVKIDTNLHDEDFEIFTQNS